MSVARLWPVALFAAFSAFAACSSGDGGTTAPPPSPPPPPPPPAPVVASVALSPASDSIVVGSTTTLNATVRDTAGRTLTGQSVAWSSSSAAIASVAGGVVTGVAPGGPVTISATVAGRTGTALITVTDFPVAAVELSPATDSILVGTTTTLTATVRNTAGGTVTGEPITWTSDDVAIATVTDGVVTGVAPGGPVTIAASVAGVTGTATITITDLPVATVSVSAPRTTVAQASTVQLTAETRAAGGQLLTGRDVTWHSSNEALATVSATGEVTAVAIGGPVTITATSEGRSGSVDLTVTFPPLAAGWQFRRPLTITTGASAAADGYSIPVTFDHQALVADGKSLASGDDVRVAAWDGTTWVELDRVLDAGSTWNAATTTIWFRTTDAIAADTTEHRYQLHYGNASAGSPPADPDRVYLFADDFEDGTLDRWDDAGGGTWQNVGTRAHRGTRAMYHGPEGAFARRMYADPALDVRDVIIEAWWNITSLDVGFNVAQLPRRVNGVGQYYTLLCRCLGTVLGFNVASFLNGTYTDIRPALGTPQANTWMRVGTAMQGGTYRVFLNGTQINTQTGLDAITSGNVGFNKFIVPSGDGVWIDDVVARRYVFPEPTAAVEAERGG